MTTDETERVAGVNRNSVSILKLKVADHTATIEDYQTIDYFMEEFGHILRAELFERLRNSNIHSWEAFIIERAKPFVDRKKIVRIVSSSFVGFLRGVELALMAGDVEEDFSAPSKKGRTRW